MNDSDLQLLENYAQRNSQDSFAKLVNRHLNLVFSAALRQVHSPQLAEEISQSVFADLARSANKLRPGTILAAWLYEVTRRTAIDVVRRESRRQLREKVAHELTAMNATADDWTEIEPFLDEAMHALDETDRAAVLLRYFENKSLREVGEALGTSDDAAQKRVSRAVERLREFFAKRGVTIGASGLAVVISANAVQAAPVGLAVAISTALTGTITTTTITTMNWISVKSIAAIAVAAITAGTVTHFLSRQEINRIRSENHRLVAQQERLAKERDAAISVATGGVEELEGLRKNQNELLRLRNEIGMLRQQTNDLVKLQEENNHLRFLLAETGESPAQAGPDSEQRQSPPRLAKLLTLPLLMYADDHQGHFPTNFEAAKAFFQKAYQADPFLRDETEFAEAAKQFEIVFHGSRGELTNAGSVILIRERQPVQRNDGQWQRAYGFADGHGEGWISPDGNFREREKIRSTSQTIERPHAIVTPRREKN